MAVNQLPVAIEVDSVPRVVDRLGGERDSRVIIHPLSPPQHREAGQARVSVRVKCGVQRKSGE